MKWIIIIFIIHFMNLNSVDLNLLVVFEALLDERNVTRAAERVARAQPSVSNALNRLRYLFKDELFIRTPNGMIPTSKALELEQPIREALNGVRIALATHDEFDPQQCEGTIHLATSDTVEPSPARRRTCTCGSGVWSCSFSVMIWRSRSGVLPDALSRPA